ncbi:MAG: hypothetical protein N4A47_00435 [Clostridia bacterium]|jgi:outer membrane murein-binding lipoprotein Lpp|nr:hypothetical protein [Clostridia bacterium]
MEEKTYALIEKMYNEFTAFKTDVTQSIDSIKTDVSDVNIALNQLTSEVEHSLNNKVRVLFDANGMTHGLLNDLSTKVDTISGNLTNLSFKVNHNEKNILELSMKKN